MYLAPFSRQATAGIQGPYLNELKALKSIPGIVRFFITHFMFIVNSCRLIVVLVEEELTGVLEGMVFVPCAIGDQYRLSCLKIMVYTYHIFCVICYLKLRVLSRLKLRYRATVQPGTCLRLYV